MIYSIAEILATMTDTIFLLWYVPNFLDTKFYQRKNLKFLIFPVMLLFFELSADYLMPGFDLAEMMIHIGIALTYSLLISGGKIFRAIIATTSYILAIMMVGSVVFMVVSWFMGDKAQAFQGTNSIARVVYLVICKTVEYFIYRIFLFVFHKDGKTNKINVIFFSTYMLLIVGGLGAIMTIALDDHNGNLTVPITVILLILALSVFFVFFFVHGLLKSQKFEYEYKFIEEKIESEKKILEESNKVWENLNKLRHDLKNHLTIIDGKLKEGDVNFCEKYVEEIYSQIDDMGDVVHTGNEIVDHLVSSKLYKDSTVKIKISGNAGILDDLPDIDIVGVIGNLIDNALEAVAKIDDDRERFIELYFLTRNKTRIVLCKNTVRSPVLENNKNLISTKKGVGHGYGQKIISSIVQKYGGFIEYSDENGMFCVQIIFPV